MIQKGKIKTLVLAACEPKNADFVYVVTAPLMPLNSIWKEENDKAVNMGLLIEVQVVACEKEDLHLGRCWWPLASVHISRSLQVKSCS